MSQQSSGIVSPLSLSTENTNNNNNNNTNRTRGNSKSSPSNPINTNNNNNNNVDQHSTSTLSSAEDNNNNRETVNFKALLNTFNQPNNSNSNISQTTSKPRASTAKTLEFLTNLTSQSLSSSSSSPSLSSSSSSTSFNKNNNNNNGNLSKSNDSSSSILFVAPDENGNRSPTSMSKQDNETIDLLDSIVNLSLQSSMSFSTPSPPPPTIITTTVSSSPNNNNNNNNTSTTATIQSPLIQSPTISSISMSPIPPSPILQQPVRLSSTTPSTSQTNLNSSSPDQSTINSPLLYSQQQQQQQPQPQSTSTTASSSLPSQSIPHSASSNSLKSISNSPILASSNSSLNLVKSTSSTSSSSSSGSSNSSTIGGGAVTPDRFRQANKGSVLIPSHLNQNISSSTSSSSSSSSSSSTGEYSPRIGSPVIHSTYSSNAAAAQAAAASASKIFSAQSTTFKAPLVVKINRESSSHSIWKSTLSGAGKEDHIKVCFDEIPGRRIVQKVSIDLTPLEIKKQLLEEVGPEFLQLIDQFELKVLSINCTFTNESLPLRRQLVMQACNISRLFPKMQLTLKDGNELKLPDTEIVDLKGHIQTELEIFELTGNGFARILESGGQEVSSFRRDLAHLRLQRTDDERENELLQYVYVLGEPMPLVTPPKITVQATYGDDVKINKRLDVSPQLTVEELKTQIFKKFALVDKSISRGDKTPNDYVIKVTGFREYILSIKELGEAGLSRLDRYQPTGKDGDFALIDYDYVRQCISKQQMLELSFTQNNILKCSTEKHQTSFIDKLLDTTDFDSDDEQPLIQHDEQLLQQQQLDNSSPSNSSTNPGGSATNSLNNSAINVGGRLPITKVNRLFRVKVVGLKNINISVSDDAKSKFGDGDRQPYCYVMAELYHGGQLIATPTFTPTIPITHMDSLHFPDWDRDVWTPFNISIRSLPRETRACFTLFVTSNSTTSNGTIIASSEVVQDTKSIPLGWVNCQLIDHKGCLRTGPVAFKLWEDDRANPIGTCIENLASKTPIVLMIEFETFVKPIVFTKEINPLIQISSSKKLEPNEARRLNGLMQSDPLVILTPDDKRLIYSYRHIYTSKPKALAKVLTSINWAEQDQVWEAYRLMKEWAELKPVQALELMDAKFADSEVRSFAIQTLKQFTDSEFSDFLLQLSQVLKYEPYHKSELSSMLIERALSNRSRIGHSFFWFLKAEMHTPEIEERYGLLLEGYLRSCGSHRQELIKQNQVLKSLYQVAMAVKNTHGTSERKKVLQDGLSKIKFPDTFQLPLDPRWEAKGLIVDKCRFMDSKKLPLWLVFENVEKYAKPLTVIFKVGDDLRQDILTLQILRTMDKFWKNGGLDLRLQPYKCVSTGDGIGMLEVVLNANTIANINKDAGGTGALLEEKTLVNWLKENNPSEQEYNKAVETFILSCAGYVVATYVMGIGDRHADNIMMTRAGHLFHIDFGHFLGNYKKKYGFKRERAPFIFTHQYMAIVGGKDSENFKFFVNTCCLAYNILRKNTDLFINLFQLMLSTGIPELQCAEDIDYLRKALGPELTDAEAAEEFTKNIIVALNTKTVLLNDIFHDFGQVSNIELKYLPAKLADKVKLGSIVRMSTYPNQIRVHSLTFDDELISILLLPPSFQSLTFGSSVHQPLSPGVLPSSLRSLTFGYIYNQPISPGVVPSSLQSLTFGHCYNQPLSQGVLPSTLQSLKFGVPSSLQSLTFGNGYNQPLSQGVLPSTLLSLKFGVDYNQPISVGVLPSSLQSLKFCSRYNQPISPDVLPASLQSLEFVGSYNQPISPGVLPSSLQSLIFGRYYNQPLSPGVLPTSLQTLEYGWLFYQLCPGFVPSKSIILSLGGSFNQPLSPGVLPSSLQSLTFSDRYNQPISIGVLPSSLQELTFGMDYNQPLSAGVLPSSLCSLTFGDNYNQPLSHGVLPSTLQSLTFGDGYIINAYHLKNYNQLLLTTVVPRSIQSLTFKCEKHSTTTPITVSCDFNQSIQVLRYFIKIGQLGVVKLPSEIDTIIFKITGSPSDLDIVKCFSSLPTQCSYLQRNPNSINDNPKYLMPYPINLTEYVTVNSNKYFILYSYPSHLTKNKVFLVISEFDNELYVYKEMNYSDTIPKRADFEVECMKLFLGDDMFVQYKDHQDMVGDKKFCILTLYCQGGDLEQLYQSKIKRDIWVYVERIVLEKLSHHRIAHLDVKPLNLFIGDDGQIVLGDFGCSSHFNVEPNQNQSSAEPTQTIFETNESNQKFYYSKSDVYSVGCTLLKLLSCIETLLFGPSFNCPFDITVLTQQLKVIVFGRSFNQPIPIFEYLYKYSFIINITTDIWNQEKLSIVFSDKAQREFKRFNIYHCNRGNENSIPTLNSFSNTHLQSKIILTIGEKCFGIGEINRVLVLISLSDYRENNVLTWKRNDIEFSIDLKDVSVISFVQLELVDNTVHVEYPLESMEEIFELDNDNIHQMFEHQQQYLDVRLIPIPTDPLLKDNNLN
ncbi:phosphatidylinositol-4,5-diphosphate 3-kinase [Cavenderia fasciculata]|uniref:phosphatidylinositol 3-kinase n=1 Tax=Cavenderia fasciculata TaxID=261658 RepID=F4PIB0_CACFS|nr:phosphatidylinositol-4,5-diphosphate 3-kinase [Cavenderia fasciculata]EGG24544.1 phosphatidylinositol-4,5-diphosphate 3-kinase [Cavenderia fasciculata]|eukprot:XP_004362395.1 phosphatidylinositol-4,5-diphosphate 3-kinase [Cavenderia fasciculata]